MEIESDLSSKTVKMLEQYHLFLFLENLRAKKMSPAVN
jgi:hypothetical protein